MSELRTIGLDDHAARQGALDTRCSILVQAPAGSGKTELLAMRFLKLLAEVEEPEQILAITFTMNATAEIRRRILAKLERAKLFAEGGGTAEGEDRQSIQTAAAALANAERRRWRLLDRPQRLNIQSIDALCLRIANQMPLSAKLDGARQRAKIAWPLYRRAARRTFDRLGGEDSELNTALRSLLLLRDSNLASCESLLAGMLATRDQWMRAFPLTGEIDWVQARTRLEAPFKRELHRVLGEAHTILSSHPHLTEELLELANYACGNSPSKIEFRLLAGFAALPAASPDSVDHWRCFCELLLTKSNRPRKRYDATCGFPAEAQQQRDRMKTLAAELADIPGLVGLLCEVRELPPPGYSDRQWEMLRHIFTALRRASSELQAVFAEQGADDFIEVGMAALQAVSGGVAGIPFLHGLRHLLVDEFQDTSRRQHELVAAILRNWRMEADAEKGRTIFLVGDPMQSIYMFRQADVELFSAVQKQGFEAGGERLLPKMLQLSTNFRSNAGLVNPLNAMFGKVFPHNARMGAAAVDFLPGVPGDGDEPEGAYQVHANFLNAQSSPPSDPLSREDKAARTLDAQLAEAASVVEIIRRELPRIEQARRDHEEFTVAVLARAKSHLAAIAAALRAEGIRFRAVELEKLGERQEILDLQSLTRALLHPMDRVAWLAVLRAPWCGLGLRDLHLLCGTDESESRGGAVCLQIEARLDRLGTAARGRVARVMAVLAVALRHRYRQSSFSSWIERTWRSLGGPACVDEAGHENARTYFRMLEQVGLDGAAAAGEAMAMQLERLFAVPDPAVGEGCGVQLMTMHKAKGLGFNVVVLPGLHRKPRSYSPVLVRYLERAIETGTELLVAPLDDTGKQTSAMNRWVRRQQEHREAEERKRLLYVACTRARERLHIFATATVANTGMKPENDSLLATAWPALEEFFQEIYAKQTARQPAQEANKIIAFPAVDRQAAVQGVLSAVAAAKAAPTLRRLPDNRHQAATATNVTDAVAKSLESFAQSSIGKRPLPSRSARILGTTVHALFERAAKLLERGVAVDELRASIPRFHRQAATLARGQGLTAGEDESCATQAAEALCSALDHPCGLWILQPHPRAQTEASWTGVLGGATQVLRIDRSFRAGARPLAEGDCLWIVDYKTASHSGGSGRDAFLDAERALYREQLARYGEMTRLAYGPDLKLRFALYYPLLKTLDWWE